jgi:GNAT superfamily N-acetyltransferase
MLLAPETTSVSLKSGETVALVVLRAPAREWAGRIETMLRHKGAPWDWQNSELLRRETGIDAWFHLLHRNEQPFAHLMVAEIGGVGLLGHVWTDPADRGKGASSLLMERALDGFRARDGLALFLGTEFDSLAWRSYLRRGFAPVEPGSGYMELYRDSRAAFRRKWFAAGDTVVEALDWPHWPAAAPLCLLDSGDALRLAGARLWSRGSSEGPLLPLIRRERQRTAGAPPLACVLRDAASPAILAIASRQPHPFWPGLELVDLFSHPQWWPRTGELLAAIPATGGDRAVAYCEASQHEKRRVIMSAGFRAVATLPQWLKPPLSSGLIDVEIFLHD